VHWILTGTHGDARPCALRPEHFRRSSPRDLEWHCESEEFLERSGERTLDRFNLSDL
jgi:hypothetical protein